jgi:hypothetical protein
MVSDDREHFDRRARQPARLGGLARHQPGQIARGTEAPFIGDPNQIDAARCVVRLQLCQRHLDVDAIGHPLGERGLIERLARGEQQRFQQPQLLGPRLRIH